MRDNLKQDKAKFICTHDWYNYSCLLQYCMPTDAPHLAKHGALAMAMSPLLWQRFKPDRFDSYSAGDALNCRLPLQTSAA